MSKATGFFFWAILKRIFSKFAFDNKVENLIKGGFTESDFSLIAFSNPSKPNFNEFNNYLDDGICELRC